VNKEKQLKKIVQQFHQKEKVLKQKLE